MRIAVLAAMGAVLCGAQTTVNGGRTYIGALKANGTTSSVDFSGAASTAPVKTGLLSARPTACTQGQIYFATDAAAGQNLSFCTTSGTPGVWATMSGGGGGSTGAGVSYCAPSSGSGSAYSCSPSPAVSAYSAGVTLAFVPNVNGTGGATTLNVSGLGAQAVKMSDGSTNPSSTDLAAGRLYFLTFDGSQFRIERGVQTKTATSHQFLTAIGADGAVSASQPAASDVTGLAASATADTTNAANISSGTLVDARLSANVAMGNRANSFTGYNDFSGGTMRLPESTVANLPAASGAPWRAYLVTDSATTGSCSVGGGALKTLCLSNGTSYDCIGNCQVAGGGGGSTTPGGSNGQIQYNNNGSFAGQSYVLNKSNFQKGMECSTGTVSYTGLTANAQSQEISILTSVPAKFRYHHVLVQEATQFTGVPALQVSMGTTGVDTDLLLPMSLKQSTAPQNYGYETPRPPALGNGTYDLVLQFTSAAPLGNGTTSNFTGGSVYWEVCGFSVQ